MASDQDERRGWGTEWDGMSNRDDGGMEYIMTDGMGGARLTGGMAIEF